MNADPGDRGDRTSRYQLRRHLSVLQAQAELILEGADPGDLEQREALHRIQRTGYELTTLFFDSPSLDSIRAVPRTVVPESVHSILVCTQNSYLKSLLDTESNEFGGFEFRRVETARGAVETVSNDDFDYLLLDAVWPDSIGVELVGECFNSNRSVPPYVLLSLYTGQQTPLGLALSGILSPTASAEQIERSLKPFVDSPDSASVAGFLNEWPAGPLGSRIESCPESVISDEGLATDAALEGDVSADVVCLSPDVYRQLSPEDIGRLRLVAPGRGRPLILIAPTDDDPFDRGWIPTLGGRRFLHRPPDLSGLITELLAQGTSFDTNPGAMTDSDTETPDC